MNNYPEPEPGYDEEEYYDDDDYDYEYYEDDFESSHRKVLKKEEKHRLM